MMWASVDIGATAGVAIWDGDNLIAHGIVKERGKKGLYYTLYGEIAESKYEAWASIVEICKLIIVEEGFGNRAKTVASQAKLRGYIEAICDKNGCRFMAVNLSEWRRCIKEDLKVSWPKDRERIKELSVKLVKDMFDIDVTDDVSDAILIGYAAQRMRLNQ
jgi:hypothetical protein